VGRRRPGAPCERREPAARSRRRGRCSRSQGLNRRWSRPCSGRWARRGS
jgi:hypothetical protein